MFLFRDGFVTDRGIAPRPVLAPFWTLKGAFPLSPLANHQRPSGGQRRARSGAVRHWQSRESSQHLPEVDTEQFISHSRGSFALLRWAPFVAAAVLPFTFAHGLARPDLLVGAVPIAAIWLASLLLTWRTRNWLWGAFGFWALIFGARMVGVHGPEIPLSQGIQWICVVVILAGAPLFFFRDRLLRFARLPAVWRDVE